MHYRRFALATAYLRCARCLSSLGPTAPIMGHAIYGGPVTEWMIDRWRGRPGNIGRPRHNDADTDELFIPSGQARAIELRCRRCRNAPRISLQHLRELAANADYQRDPKFPDNGRCDIYV